MNNPKKMFDIHFLIHNQEVRYWREDWFHDQFQVITLKEWKKLESIFNNLGIRTIKIGFTINFK